jgi:hypothetical protein
MDSIFWYGYHKPLQIEDIYPLNSKYEIKAISDQFESLWTSQVSEYETKLKEFQLLHPEIELDSGGKRKDAKIRTWAGFVKGEKKPIMPPKRPELIWMLYKMFGKTFMPFGLVSSLYLLCFK